MGVYLVLGLVAPGAGGAGAGGSGIRPRGNVLLLKVDSLRGKGGRSLGVSRDLAGSGGTGWVLSAG